MKRRKAGRSASKKVLNNEETRRVHRWVPQGHSTIAASLDWAIPSVWAGKEMEKKGMKEEKLYLNEETKSK